MSRLLMVEFTSPAGSGNRVAIGHKLPDDDKAAWDEVAHCAAAMVGDRPMIPPDATWWVRKGRR